MTGFVGTRLYLMFFFAIFVRRSGALAQEDPKNYHIFEVDFKRLIEAEIHHTIPPATHKYKFCMHHIKQKLCKGR